MNAAIDKFDALATRVEEETATLFSDGRVRSVDDATSRRLKEATERLLAPLQEVKHTLHAVHDNRSFQEMVDKFLAADRKASRIADDAEAAAIERFRNAVVVVFSESDRIEVRSGVVDMFFVSIVRAGKGLFRYKQVYNEFIGEIRSESITVNADPKRKAIALGTTFWLDRDEHWTKVDGDDAAIRAAIGEAADGVSDDSMVQMVYGALSGIIDDANSIADSALGEAREFITGEFTEDGGGDDDDEDDDEDEEEEEGSSKRRKTEDDDDDGEDDDGGDE